MKDLFDIKYDEKNNVIIIETNEYGVSLLKELEKSKNKTLSEIISDYIKKATYVNKQRNSRKFHKKRNN